MPLTFRLFTYRVPLAIAIIVIPDVDRIDDTVLLATIIIQIAKIEWIIITNCLTIVAPVEVHLFFEVIGCNPSSVKETIMELDHSCISNTEWPKPTKNFMYPFFLNNILYSGKVLVQLLVFITSQIGKGSHINEILVFV